MSLPRWTVYPALVIIAVLLVMALPERGGEDPYAGAATGPSTSANRKPQYPKVVVLGIDGMDPDILREIVEEDPDRTRNFRWLMAQQDGIQSLGTSCPPQSPVAWTNFITGRNPGGHGIYDFIHRDRATRGPAGSTTKSDDPGHLWLPGRWRLPMGGDVESNRSGEPFWSVLRRAGVPADIWRMPANIPVEPSNGLSFPGMMTPALDSAYGQCSFFSTDNERVIELDYSRAKFVEKRGNKVESRILGPPNPFKDLVPAGEGSDHLTEVFEPASFTAYIDIEANAVAVHIDGGETVILSPGEWSGFVRLDFPLLPAGMTSVSGIVRFYLRSIEPEFELYASPVNFDPEAPALTVSEPADASAELARAIGRYYTQGMPQDVNALKGKILTDDEFMQQANHVFLERTRMLDYAIDRYLEDDEGGLLFFYYSSVDLICHMMWRHTDAGHPFYDGSIADQSSSWWSGRDESTWRDILKDLYVKFDPVLGTIRERIGDDATIIVMSDHGFATYRRKFSLNTWLYENGYLVLQEGQTPEKSPIDKVEIFVPGVVDWTKTRAYGMGFNGLFLNQKDREEDNPLTEDVKDPGIVEAGAEADELLLEIKRKLEALVDDQTGLRPIIRCDLAKDVYHGEREGEGPDMVIGYNAGYGNSDEASLGRITPHVLEDNTGKTFNGHHLMVPDVVSGLLLTNRPIRDGFHRLEDLTVEVLAQYGVEPVEGMVGHRVLE